VRVLVLAAGMGRRFGNSGRPKVLERLLGLPLLERVILTVREAGPSEFCVVVGHSNGEIINALGDGSRLGVRITYVNNEDWEKGNAYSVLAAKEVLNGDRFLLVMGDHQFDPEIIRRLVEIRISEGCVACVDRNLSSVFDVHEATKVLLEDGKVRDVGKNLGEFNAVDCGIFLCTSDVFSAVQECVARGQGELSHAIALLARQGKVRAMDVKGAFWFDVDTPGDLREAKRRILRALSKKEDGIVSKSINRRISTRISARLAGSGITPMQMSILSFLLGLLAVPFFSSGQYPFLFAGGMLIQLSSILDGCDGELARLKFRTTRRGGFLDSVLDRYADAFMIISLAYGYWRIAGGEFVWLACLLALSGSFAVSYTRARYEGVFGTGIRPGGIPATRDVRIFLLAVGAFVNQPLPALAVVGVMSNAEAIRRLIRWR